jgi:hypothetical protein
LDPLLFLFRPGFIEFVDKVDMDGRDITYTPWLADISYKVVKHTLAGRWSHNRPVLSPVGVSKVGLERQHVMLPKLVRYSTIMLLSGHWRVLSLSKSP